MYKLSISALLVAGSVVAFADINHANLINIAGGGTAGIAGADLSSLETGETTFGYGAQTTAVNIMADDFTVGAGGFNVTAIQFYMYQTGATTPTITSVEWAIGGAATTTLTSTAATSTWWAPNGVGVYRVSGSTTDPNRRIQLVTVDVADFFLAAGTHFLSWSATGSASFSGPWQPHNPTSLAAFGQNGMQSIGGGAFAPVFADGVVGADLPFTIVGEAVPEPTTMAVLGLGAAALLRRKFKKA